VRLKSDYPRAMVVRERRRIWWCIMLHRLWLKLTAPCTCRSCQLDAWILQILESTDRATR